MSTSYNNRWVPDRSRRRRPNRPLASRGLGQPPAPPRQLPGEYPLPMTPPSEAESPHEPRGHAHAARKRPRWIDRDT